MKTKTVIPQVIFNASVIFSAFRSSKGASRVLMLFLNNHRINGIISNIILDEVMRNASQIPMNPEQLKRHIVQKFGDVLPAPEEKTISHYMKYMIDPGDTHLFATYEESKCDYLVSLDKHHVLALQGKIKGVSIVSPNELLNLLKR